MNAITEGFPYSKQEFGNICATVDLLILNVCKNAAQQYLDVTEIRKGYLTLKYPLFAIWEYYGFGDINEIIGSTSSMSYKTLLYQAFKVDTVNTLRDLINGVAEQNPFDFYGKINNSDKVVEKLLIVYRHLLANIQSGRLIL